MTASAVTAAGGPAGLVAAAAGADRATPLGPPSAVTVRSATEIESSTPIRPDEPYLEGHYPDYTVLPGVFVVDAAFDAVRTLVAATRPGEPVELAAVRSVRFDTPLRPGDTLAVHCSCVPDGDELAATVTARTGERVAARAVLRFRSGQGREPGGTATAALGRSHDHAAVRALLPHRWPMLLVDRATEVDPPDRISTVKAISGSEPCYAGLAEDAGPEAYAYPPSLLMESWGQGAGVLWMERLRAEGRDRDGALILAEIRGVDFHRTVHPGDVLQHYVRIEHVTAGALFFAGECRLGDEPVATVRLATAVMRRTDTLGVEGR